MKNLGVLLLLQLLLASPLSVSAAESGASEGEEILFGLRPSQRMQREVQASLGVAPLTVFNLGPSVSWFGRIQTPYRVFFGFEMHFTPDNRPIQALLGEFGVSFLGRKGGPWAGVLAGATYIWGSGTESIGFQPAIKLRAGWDLMIGEHFSVGLNVGAIYMRVIPLTRNSGGPDSDPSIPIEVAIPLRIWI